MAQGESKQMSDIPRTDMMEQHAPVGLRRNSAFEQSLDLSRQLERELTAANERITQLERENDALRADLLLWEEKEAKP